MGVTSLLEFLQTRAAPHYRGTARYDGDSTDILYLRDDLKTHRLRSEVDRMLERLRSESTPSEEQSFPFGDMHATVRLFEDAVILHFPRGTDRGMVVALEPGAAADLNTFVGDCLDKIEE